MGGNNVDEALSLYRSFPSKGRTYCQNGKKNIIKGKFKMTRKERARAWVQGYSITGTAIVVAAVVPGSTSLALIGLEATMYFHIAEIYGRPVSMKDAKNAVASGFLAKAIGSTIAAKLATLEALNFAPGYGWVVKAPIAYSVITVLGEVIIDQFERQ